MQFKTVTAAKHKNIALVAHDNMKPSLLNWCVLHKDKLSEHTLYATGTTGSVLKAKANLDITSFISGPLGGDQQIGALITEQKIDMLIFFWDPLEAQPHDPDVKALLRLAAVWNIPVACNQSTADLLIHSSLFNNEYPKTIPDYESYLAKRT